MESDSRYSVGRNLVLLAVAAFTLSFGFSIYNGALNNFIVERLHIQPGQYGEVEALREVPGILSVFLAGLLIFLLEPTLGALALGVMGAGFLAMSQVTTLPAYLAASVLWSVGFHVWAPLSATIVLGVAEQGREGRRLGQVGAAGSIGGPLGLGVLWLLSGHFSFRLTFSQFFLLAGTAVLLAGLVVSRVKVKNFYQRKERVLIKREYRVYYLLTFLDGCRKQIFTTFAIFALVKVYHTSLSTVAILMVINGVMGGLLNPWFGRLVDRWGEKRALTLNYVLIISVFVGYAVFRDVRVLYPLYCADSVLFGFNVAISTYLSRIAKPEDVRPTLAMGISTNHVAAVLTPLFGGLLWEALGYRVVFLGGIGVVLLALWATRLLPEGSRREMAERSVA